MAAFNTIIIGQPWTQTFRFPDGALDVAGGETLRTSWRKNPASPVLFSPSELNGGIARVGNDYTVQLTDVQTAQLAGINSVAFDIYVDKAGASRALQVRVHVQVRTGL